MKMVQLSTIFSKGGLVRTPPPRTLPEDGHVVHIIYGALLSSKSLQHFRHVLGCADVKKK